MSPDGPDAEALIPLLGTVGNALDLFSLLLDPGEALLDAEGARERRPP
jgi:hypothetical protein